MSRALSRWSLAWSGMPQVHTASYCAWRVAQFVGVSRSWVRAYMRCMACWPAGRGRGEEDAEIFPGAGLRGADGADDLRCPAVHAGRALRRRGGQDEPPDEGGPHQRDLLGDEAADGEAQQIGLAKVQAGGEGDSVAGHLLDGVRGDAGGPADSGVVEGDDPSARGQRVDQRGVPAVQV